MDKKQFIDSLINHAQKSRIRINPDNDSFKRITGSLLKRKEKHGEPYCPCRIITSNYEIDKEIICPCVYHRGEIELQGHCLCSLFVR